MEQLNFADVIQKSFIAMSMGSAERITTINIVINLSMSFLIGLFIFFIYKKTFQGVLYQRSFNISLVLITSITSLIIMTISGNLVLSLGMVGALSIVRFRTPIKDSMDLAYLFWAIATGIANGVGYYNIAIVGSVLIAAFLLLMTRRTSNDKNAFLLVLHLQPGTNETDTMTMIESHVDELELKSKTAHQEGVELTLQLRLAKKNSQFVDELIKKEGVTRATLVSYEQDYSAV